MYIYNLYTVYIYTHTVCVYIYISLSTFYPSYVDEAPHRTPGTTTITSSHIRIHAAGIDSSVPSPLTLW